MKLFMVMSIVLVGVLAEVPPDLDLKQWSVFKSQFGKVYASEVEESFRMKIFMDNLHLIQKHNKLYEAGLSTSKLGITQFADMLNYEYRQMLLPAFSASDVNMTGIPFFVRSGGESLPDSVDWRRSGAVTRVKNQSPCGSCYAFSATGAIEGQIFRSTSVLTSFSEQNLLDCTFNHGNNGCNGGLPSVCFSYVASNGGLDIDASYGYQGAVGQCRYDPQNSGGKISGYNQVVQSEHELQAAVANIGPISVAIDAMSYGIQHYTVGINDDPTCDPNNLNHAVLVVGYSSENGQDYWIVKNSWGDAWGEGGYIRMIRNKNNQCGIVNVATYPYV